MNSVRRRNVDVKKSKIVVDEELRKWSNDTLASAIEGVLNEAVDKRRAVEEVERWLRELREEAARRASTGKPS